MQNQLHNRTVDHAIEYPDTVIDDCEVLFYMYRPTACERTAMRPAAVQREAPQAGCRERQC